MSTVLPSSNLDVTDTRSNESYQDEDVTSVDHFTSVNKGFELGSSSPAFKRHATTLFSTYAPVLCISSLPPVTCFWASLAMVRNSILLYIEFIFSCVWYWRRKMRNFSSSPDLFLLCDLLVFVEQSSYLWFSRLFRSFSLSVLICKCSFTAGCRSRSA